MSQQGLRKPILKSKKDLLPQALRHEIKDTFDLFDFTKCQKIESNQLRPALQELGFDLRPEELVKIGLGNKDGQRIEFSEFLELVTLKYGQRNPVKNTRKAFRQFLDGETDMVEVEHLNKIVKELRDGFGKEDLKRIMAKMDEETEVDQKEEEFLAMIKKTSLW